MPQPERMSDLVDGYTRAETSETKRNSLLATDFSNIRVASVSGAIKSIL